MAVSRSRKSDGKRDSIVHAATGVINAKGFARATMSEIAASLNLRDATLYYYYPNKVALAYACHCRSFERFEKLLKHAEDAEGTGAARMRCLIRRVLEDQFENGPQLYFGDYSYLGDEQRRKITQWADRLKGMLEHILKDGIKDGSIVPCDTRIAAQLIIGMVIWLAKWIPAVEGLTVESLEGTIVTMMLGGLEADPAAAMAAAG
ncbi:TetR/AcrR family transcriptional regulator [Gimibacter soli]|uniref:TetR/AcrR family transcriptional regulator n=1 Tax=Gimibacter soli TaxID=3024400 RepID=A0AAE9XTB8_9PROT|nr:TetR/AcrR family transcriptional regulator [Gimibacter soli]WCL53855.1 TetR/AcrR family transcriptional regulator [Gimibacter soli]